MKIPPAFSQIELVAAFAYGRVSSRANGAGVSRQEQSIEVQDANLRNYIAEAGIPLGAFMRDDGTERFFSERGSGAFKKQDIRTRPEGRKMWEEIIRTRRDHPHAQIHFLLTKVDRIGRGFLATQNMFAELRQLRVKVHIINLGGKSFDTDSLMGQKIIADMAWVSEVEVAS